MPANLQVNRRVTAFGPHVEAARRAGAAESLEAQGI